MTRDQAIARAHESFDSGDFFSTIARRVAIPTESQNPARADVLMQYLTLEMVPAFEAMGFTCQLLTHPKAKAAFLFAERFEDEALPTVLGYGHGDVIRGLEPEWKPNLSPWVLTDVDGVWFGRGIADNKGQHTINMEALKHVLTTRGKLGFNSKYLIEMGEEMGSPGLREVCEQYRSLLSADLLIASDGPRLQAERPTIFLGSRGGANFDLTIEARSGGHHSGNWGGLISNPGIQLAHAIASITSPSGQIKIKAWVPDAIPASVRRALADCEVSGGAEGPVIEPDWGEPDLSPAEQVYGWCSFEVLAFKTGNPETPVNAIPPKAWARCQLRFVVGIDPYDIIPALERHLKQHGFDMVKVTNARESFFNASRTDPDNPWVQWAAKSLSESTQKKTAILPNIGGGLPNDIFMDVLELPTVWVPHSFAGCSQHAPNEHLPSQLMREGLGIMTGLYWDLGNGDAPPVTRNDKIVG